MPSTMSGTLTIIQHIPAACRVTQATLPRKKELLHPSHVDDEVVQLRVRELCRAEAGHARLAMPDYVAYLAVRQPGERQDEGGAGTEAPSWVAGVAVSREHRVPRPYERRAGVGASSARVARSQNYGNQ